MGTVLSQSLIFGQNPKIGCQEFNDLQTPKLSKKQLCDRTVGMRPLPLGMLGDRQYEHPLLDLLERHRGLLPAVSTRLSR
jgi:hypothetical protein